MMKSSLLSCVGITTEVERLTPSNARFVGACGLQRAGSTLLTQLLAEHPDVA
jgi:hypothetical protein